MTTVPEGGAVFWGSLHKWYSIYIGTERMPGLNGDAGSTDLFCVVGTTPCPLPLSSPLSSFLCEVGGGGCVVWVGGGFHARYTPHIPVLIHLCVYTFRCVSPLLSFTIVGISTTIKVFIPIPKMRFFGNVGGYLF